MHDTLLVYGRTNDATFNQLYKPYTAEYIATEYRFTDANGRRYAKALEGERGERRRKGARKYLDESPGCAINDLWYDDGLVLSSSSSERGWISDAEAACAL